MRYAYDDTLDRDHLFKEAVQDVADRIGTDPKYPFKSPYHLAAYNIREKPAWPLYAKEIRDVLLNYDKELGWYENQVTGVWMEPLNAVQQWFERGSGYTWVHCVSDREPELVVYRVYICAALDRTARLLSFLLSKYLDKYPGEKLHFKIASHDEAQRRNDTIVSWHKTLAEAMLWCRIANKYVSEYPEWFLGNAPASTFGGIGTRSVGIDVEVPHTSSTSRIAKRGLNLWVKHSPFI